MVSELRFAKTDATGILVQGLVPAVQADFHFVEIRMWKVPQLDSGQRGEVNRMRHRFARNAGGRNILRGLCHNLLAVTKNRFESQRLLGRFQMLKMAIEIQSGMIAHHVLWLGENILDEY